MQSCRSKTKLTVVLPWKLPVEAHGHHKDIKIVSTYISVAQSMLKHVHGHMQNLTVAKCKRIVFVCACVYLCIYKHIHVRIYTQMSMWVPITHTHRAKQLRWFQLYLCKFRVTSLHHLASQELLQTDTTSSDSIICLLIYRNWFTQFII